MNIGVIGVGVVGSAVKHGLERIGHNVSVYDIKFPETSVNNVLAAELIFICVSTPSLADGSCDVTRVERVVTELDEHNYAGVVAIKSTVVPGTTDRLAQKTKLRLVFCPEFLRERAAIIDFVENHDVCVIGTPDEDAFEVVKRAHGTLPKQVFRVSTTEAELAKYFSNTFNALRIVFANEFFEVCRALGANYTNIKNVMVQRYNIEDSYLECNENYRGYAGVCLPKDTVAFMKLVDALGLDIKLFHAIVEENKKFRATVPDGMRFAQPDVSSREH